MTASSRGDHFLDPSMAACRRRLPLTPAAAATVIDAYSTNSPILRRGSSPRILPAAPSSVTLTAARSYCNAGGDLDTKFPPSPQSPTENESQGGLERRPSTGRRLPLPPTVEYAQVDYMDTTRSSRQSHTVNGSPPTYDGLMEASFCSVHSADSIDEPVAAVLQRSASTRQPPSRSFPEPPSPTCDNDLTNRLMRKNSFSTAPPEGNYDDPIAEKVAHAISRHSSRENKPRAPPPPPPTIVSPVTSITASRTSPPSNSLSACTDGGMHHMPMPDIGVRLYAPTSGEASPTTLQKPSASAPQSPRFNCGVLSSCNLPRYDETVQFAPPSPADETAGQPLTGRPKTTKSTSSSKVTSFTPARKHSNAFENSIGRNGSMAFLLEQRHTLRRHTESPAASGTAMLPPCSFSLLPSMDQLNYGSKSSSDVEEAANGGGDARIHGIDPSLYGMGSGHPLAGMTTSASLNSASSAGSFAEPQTMGVPATNGAGSSPTNALPRDLSAASGASTSWAQTPAVTPTPDGAVAAADAQQPRPSGLGLIYCTLQHFPVRKRLRVSVLKITGLAGQLKPELEILPFCKVNLLPSKQKQCGVVKRGRNAVFNQEFFFDNVTTEELDSKTLSIEVCHQSAQKLQKDLAIGEVFVPLKDLTQLQSKKEVRIVEELKYSVSAKKIGKISLTTCIENEACRLTINIIKVDDLPKWGIIGAPDVCVRITMAQGSSPPQTKSSRVLKSTTSAVYKEAVMFLISTKKADLQHTRITISVHDLSRSTTGNDVIGSVYLGELAVDKSEVEQWRQTIGHWGKEYKGAHHLKLNHQNAPDVHVSETHSDTEDVE